MPTLITMAIEIENTVVTCLRCGEDYATWLGMDRGQFSPDPCPRCGFIPSEDPGLYRDGILEPVDEDEARV